MNLMNRENGNRKIRLEDLENDGQVKNIDARQHPHQGLCALPRYLGQSRLDIDKSGVAG